MTLTFVVKSVYSVDAGAFVISTQEEKVLGILDLVRQQKTNGFQRLFSSIHVIAQKQVIGFGWKTAVLEQT